MAGKKKDTAEATIEILQISRGRLTVWVRGVTPLIFNRMSEKVKREMLFPAKKKNDAEKASTLKHRPMEEYQSSPYRVADPAAPTLLCMPSVAFKGALRSVAVDMPGAAKAQIGRLTYIEGVNVPIYGVPMLKMDVVRQAGKSKAPDIRTRAVLPEWAATFSIVHQEPLITQKQVAHLLAAAGVIIGVGDYRPEKGAGNFGQFEIVSPEDTDAIVASGGRAAQEAAMESPDFYDAETQDLYEWYCAELARRGMKLA
jgi:hypothetical protein